MTMLRRAMQTGARLGSRRFNSASANQISGDYSKCGSVAAKKGVAAIAHPKPDGNVLDFLFQTSFPLYMRAASTAAVLFIGVSSFAPTWMIPFNRYWVKVYRNNSEKY